MPDKEKPIIVNGSGQARVEPDKNIPENLLDLDHYHAVYGRLFIAQGVDPEKVADLIDPKKPIEEDIIQSVNKDNRNYDSAVSGYSMHERREAWKGAEFNKAYSDWSGSLLSSIHLTSTDEQKMVIQHFFNKEYSEINDTDIRILYDLYCQNGSKITDFALKAAENSNLNKKELETLAGKLFGKQSGSISVRIFELEASLKSNKDEAIQKIFNKDGGLNLDRINNPTEDEKVLLNLLSQHIEKPKTKTEVKTSQRKSGNTDKSTARPKETLRSTERPNHDTRIRTGMIVTDVTGEKYYIEIKTPPALSVLINGAIVDVQKDRESIDPITNLPFLDLPKEEKLDYLRKELEKAKLAETSGAKRDEKKTPVKIIRISNGEIVEESTKGYLWDMWKKREPKYIRNPLEREAIRHPDDGKVYILQTFYDKITKEELARFYVNRGDAGSLFVDKRTTPLDEIMELFDGGEIELADDSLPSKTEDDTPASPPSPEPEPAPQTQNPDKDEILPGTFMAGDKNGVSAQTVNTETIPTTEPPPSSADFGPTPASTQNEIINTTEDDAKREANTAVDDEQRRARTAADDAERLKRIAEETKLAENDENRNPVNITETLSSPDSIQSPVENTTTRNPEVDEEKETQIDEEKPTDDFDPIAEPGYDWNAALIAARISQPNNNLYREGSSFSKLISQLTEGEIVPSDVKKGKDYRRLRTLQKDAENGGIPIPTKDLNES